MHRVTQLGRIGLDVTDLTAWDRFATRILGLAPNGSGPRDERRFRMDDNHHRIEVHPADRDDLRFASWEVADLPSLHAIVDRLQTQGVEARWASDDEARSRRVLHLAELVDPDGTATELHVGPSMQREQPFRSPRGLGGFVAGGLGFGHIVLAVDDLERSLRFYCDGLGLRLSDYIDLDLGPAGRTMVAFLRAGPRHHSLAIGQFPTEQRLHHFMLQLRDPDDVGTTYDLCRDEDVPIASTLGRHTNDGMLSFYMRSPSGFQVEIGSGGIEVDDTTWEVALHHAPSVWGHRPA